MRVNTLDEEAADEFQFQIIESTHKQALPQVINSSSTRHHPHHRCLVKCEQPLMLLLVVSHSGGVT